jgi:hypothetical protein
MTQDQFLENQFAAAMPMPALQISQGPQEVLFAGQSPAGSVPIGTSFIQGTGQQSAGLSGTTLLLIVAAVVVFMMMSGGRRHHGRR